MDSLRRHFDALDARAKSDAERFAACDGDLCMLCHAYGADKRSLFLACFYDVREAVPEFLSLSKVENEELRKRGFYLRICKSCRARLLGALRTWADECRAMRDTPKDHDGDPLYGDEDADIPVRVDGATIWMTAEQYERYSKAAK